MTKFILIVISLYLIISNTWLILIVGGTALCWYSCKKKPNLFSKLLDCLSGPPPKNTEPEDDLSFENREFETYKERLARTEAELEKNMKPGFQDDPEWQEKSKRLCRIRGKNRDLADKEMAQEILQEAEEYAEAGEWSEIPRLHQELKDLAAKS